MLGPIVMTLAFMVVMTLTKTYIDHIVFIVVQCPDLSKFLYGIRCGSISWCHLQKKVEKEKMLLLQLISGASSAPWGAPLITLTLLDYKPFRRDLWI